MGFRYWKLHLYDEDIVAYPYTFLESFGVALRLYMGRYSPDPAIASDERMSAGAYAGTPGLSSGAKRHYVSLVRKIEMISSHLQNKLLIEMRSGERQTYVIPIRWHTDFYRRKLRELYPDIYAERDFPGTWLGRLLKR
jgi:hypothetical protein